MSFRRSQLSLCPFPIHRLLYDTLHNVARQRAFHIAENLALTVYHKRSRKAPYAVLGKNSARLIHHNRERIAVFIKKGLNIRFASLAAHNRPRHSEYRQIRLIISVFFV